MNSGFSGHRTRERLWFPGRFCTRLIRVQSCRGAAVSRASWTVLLRKHLLEMDGWNRACLDPPLPALLHLVSSIQQEGGQGGQLLCPLPKGNPASGGSSSPLRHGSWDACRARRGEALQDGLSEGLVHLSTQMFGHLIKISKPPKYPTWGC